jgi:tetratricopeptide (TPR) repeat protein
MPTRRTRRCGLSCLATVLLPTVRCAFPLPSPYLLPSSADFSSLQQTKDYTSAISDCDACLVLNDQYFKALRTRARAHLAQESFEAAVRDFEAAYQAAPEGSNDEGALKKDLRDAKQALKKSKMKVRTSFALFSFFSSSSDEVVSPMGLTTLRLTGSLQNSRYSLGSY